MYTMKDLQRITGFTRDQLRDRLGGLRAIGAQDRARGPRNAILVGDSTLAYLRRIKELEAREVGPQEALAQIMEEVNGNGKGPKEDNSTVAQSGPQHSQGIPDWSAIVDAKDELISELRGDRDHWRTLALSLQQQLALPSPERSQRPRWVYRLMPWLSSS